MLFAINLFKLNALNKLVGYFDQMHRNAQCSSMLLCIQMSGKIPHYNLLKLCVYLLTRVLGICILAICRHFFFKNLCN
jgi:hypothetical protein